MDTPELNALLDWVRRQAGELFDCGDPWQITIHGGPAGDVKAEVNRKQCLIPTQKERQHDHTNGHVRSLR